MGLAELLVHQITLTQLHHLLMKAMKGDNLGVSATSFLPRVLLLQPRHKKPQPQEAPCGVQSVAVGQLQETPKPPATADNSSSTPAIVHAAFSSDPDVVEPQDLDLDEAFLMLLASRAEESS